MASRHKKPANHYSALFLVFTPMIAVTMWFSMANPAPPPLPVTDDFSLSYQYSNETFYRNITVTGNRISYTYSPRSQTNCRPPSVGTPCWKKAELVTRYGTLTPDEYSSVHDLVADPAFLALQKTYGGASSLVRFYPQILKAHIGNTDREITYQTFPQAKPMPDPYKQIVIGLEQLVRSKFP